MRTGIALLILSLAASSSFASEPRFRVGYIDPEDPYTTSPSLKKCLGELKVPAKSIRASSKPTVGKFGAVFIGSFATADRKTGKTLKRNWKNLVEYVRRGGVLVIFGQADEDERSLDWLPPPLVAERGDRDGMTAWVPDSTHPILTTPNAVNLAALMESEISRGQYKYSTGAYAATDVFVRTEGFQTILSTENGGAYPILMVGSLGKGAVIIMAMSPDRLCIRGRDDIGRDAGRELVQNLVQFAQNVGSKPWKQSPDVFAAASLSHHVEVFHDTNGNGIRDADEPGVPDVVVTHDFKDQRTGTEGVVNIDVDAKAPGIISIRVPDGMFATRPWFESARSEGPHRFGLRPSVSPRQGSGSLVHLTDVHIGRTKAIEDSEAFKTFLRSLSARSSPDDLFVFTGDLTHTGRPSELKLFREGIQTLENPVSLVMGNHDQGIGPDKGKLFEEFLGPNVFSREWNGFLIVSLPELGVKGPAQTWFRKTVAESILPVIVLVHFYPRRTLLDRLDRNKVVAVLSGHWHGDLVSLRSGIADINGPAALMGNWDFTPGSARVLTLRDGRVVDSEMLPFVRRPTATILLVKLGGLICNLLGQKDGPHGTVESTVRRLSAFSWFLDAATEPSEARCGGKHSPPDAPPPVEVRWASAVPGRVLLASPTLSGRHLIVPYRDGGETGWGGGVCSIDTVDGAVQWCHQTASSVTVDPIVSRGIVHFSEVVGTLWGVRAKDGAVLWSSRLDKVVQARYAEHFIHSSPLLKNGYAYYCYQRGPFRVRLRDGAIDWFGKPFNGADSFAHSRGAIAENSLYCGAFRRGLYRYTLGGASPAPGKKLGSWDINGDLKTREGTLFVLARSALIQVDTKTGDVTKKVKVPYANLPPGVVIDGDDAIVPDGNRGLRKISISTGKTRWRKALGDGPMSFILNRRDSAGLIGTPRLSGNTLYVPGPDGTLLALNRRTGKERKRWELGIPLVSSPVVGRESVYIADYGGTIYSIAK